MSILEKLSEEQLAVVQATRCGLSSYVDAVPGAGKSTTTFGIAEDNSDKGIMSVTFSSQLKLEGRIKKTKLGLDHLEIESYHSLAITYYPQIGFDDRNIINLLDKDLNLRTGKEITSFDIIILDEAQDMSPLFYKLVSKFIRDIGFKGVLIVMGDKDQAIYEYRGADTRFLTCADRIYNDFAFRELKFSQSFRLPNQVSQFINEAVLGYEKIKTDKDGYPVRYMIGDPYLYYLWQDLYKIIIHSVTELGYKYDDIFVLAPSVSSSGAPIKKFENYLAGKGIPIYIPHSDEANIKEEDLKNKVGMITYHKSKGRERKLVIVMGADESYYKYQDTETTDFENCPNPFFVAFSRPLEQLIVVHGVNNSNPFKKLPFLKKTIRELARSDYCDVSVSGPPSYKENIKARTKGLEYERPIMINRQLQHSVAVTQLTKFLSDRFESWVLPQLTKLFTKISPSNKLKLKGNIKGTHGNEQVSDINGLVIPTIWEYNKVGKSSLWIDIDKFKRNQRNPSYLVRNNLDKMVFPCQTVSDYLRMGNMYITVKEGIESNLNQIKSFNWLKQEHIDICLGNLDGFIRSPEDLDFEKSFDYEDKDYLEINVTGSPLKIEEINQPIYLSGIMDAVDHRNVYEFKCVGEFSTSHYLQVIMYAWMWKNSLMQQIKGDRKFFLFNIIQNEIFELDFNNTELIDTIARKLLIDKYCRSGDINDDEFVNKCLASL